MERFFSPLQRLLLTWLLLIVTGSLTLDALSFVSEILSILVAAGLIAFLLDYPVARLQKLVPRGIAAVLVYGLAGITVALAGLTVVPLILEQGRLLSTNFPNLLDSARQQLHEFQAWSELRGLPFDVPLVEQQILSQLKQPAQAIASGSLNIVLGTFNGFLDLILILVLSFYMLLDGERVWRGLTAFLAPEVRRRLTQSLRSNLQRFVSGQLSLGLFMAIGLAFGFWLLRVPFFLLFAVFIGTLEVLPFVGATIGITIVTLIVASLNLWKALQVVALAIALQQVKDNLVAPRIMGNLTGLSPVIIFSALLLGARVGGLLGVILAIPLTGFVRSLAEILLDPTLPPQTGQFFCNPLAKAANEADGMDFAKKQSAIAPALAEEEPTSV
ncbi:AI-2E family transporter [Almyronema epifaneia]|uniref:AI-2E family transporter n=1 Tax=Almyronema epifaneia S1 TaxID=2991925 RepID=A0ABW6IJ17_9CYAN